MVRDALAPIWLTIPETARRILQRIGTVLDYAHIEGWRGEEAALRSVRKGLPRQPTQENHFAALPYADVPALVTRLKKLPDTAGRDRSEEPTSELQSLMRTSYAVFCLKKKNTPIKHPHRNYTTTR